MSRAPWKFLLIVALLLTLCLGTSRILFVIVDGAYQGSTSWVRKRLQLALAQVEHLPGADHKLMLLLGASDVETGFDPVSFDADMNELGVKSTSYNLGFRNFDPELLHLMSRRLHESLSRQNKVADIIFVKFTPLRTTVTYSKSLANRFFTHIDDCETAIYSSHMIFEDARHDPSKMIQVWATKDLFGGISPPSAEASLIGLYYKYVPWGIGLDQNIVKLRVTWDELWKNPRLNNDPAWDPDSRGSFFFGFPENQSYAESLFATISSPEIQKGMLDRFADTSDAYYLYFDPRLLNEFALALRELKAVAKKVVILDWPDSQSIGRPPEAMARWKAAVDEIRMSSGDPVIDLAQKLPPPSPELNPNDYFDLFHLNFEGRKKVSRLLAQAILREHLLDPALVNRE